MWVDGGGGGWGLPPHTCTHTHTHTCTHTCGKHDNFMQMATPIGESLGIPYDVISFFYAHACACGWGAPSHHPHPNPPTLPPQRGTPGIIQNSIALELIEIFQLFEDLKSVETPPPMGGCIIWWVGGWVDGWGQVKSLKI